MKTSTVVTHTVQIPASVDKAFWSLLKEARAKGIDTSFDYWQPRQWPPVVGTYNDFKLQVGWFSTRGVSRFVEFDPPHHLVIESVGQPSRC